jgi:hypothetical protein
MLNALPAIYGFWAGQLLEDAGLARLGIVVFVLSATCGLNAFVILYYQFHRKRPDMEERKVGPVPSSVTYLHRVLEVANVAGFLVALAARMWLGAAA